MPKPLVGIFVGGEGRRMGGVAKGMLHAPGSDETLVTRLERVAREALGEVDVVLVGRAEAYASVGLPSLADEPPGIGPLGGLVALLSEARRRQAPFALALACDLPFVSPDLVARLASFAPDATALAPRQAGRWMPLCARYGAGAERVARELAGEGQRSLQPVLERSGTRELPLESDEELADWDEPGDLAQS